MAHNALLHLSLQIPTETTQNISAAPVDASKMKFCPKESRDQYIIPFFVDLLAIHDCVNVITATVHSHKHTALVISTTQVIIVRLFF